MRKPMAIRRESITPWQAFMWMPLVDKIIGGLAIFTLSFGIFLPIVWG